MRKMRTKTAKGKMIYVILLILLKLIKLTSCKDDKNYLDKVHHKQ